MKCTNKVFTYNIPWVTQVGMCFHDEAHSDDFEDHFYAKNDQEHKI